MAWLALLASVGLQAVITALLGLSLTAADSLLLLALAAGASMLLGAVPGRRQRGTSVVHAPGARTLLWLNLWTAISFIAFFLGVAVHSAAVVFTLEASFAPLAVTAWSVYRTRRGNDQTVPGPAQWWAACMLAVLGSLLVVVIGQSDSGGTVALLAAAVLGVTAGIAAGGLVIVCQSLGQSGVGVGQVMAHRFYATIAFAAAVLLTMVPCGLLAPPKLNIGLLGAAALTTVVAPLFMLQYAVQQLPAVSATAALATMPAITIAIELASGRPLSWIVLLLGALIVPANLALLLTQQRRRPSSWLSVLRSTVFAAEGRTQPAPATA
jgi:drug/metabolite transporter (DMT)-like permease